MSTTPTHGAMSTPLVVTTAAGFWARFCGLMLTASLPEGAGLLLRDCASVHTCLMRYPIDVVYLDRFGAVVRIDERLAPWRASFGGRGSVHTLELAAGACERLGLGEGDELGHVLPGFGSRAKPAADAPLATVSPSPATTGEPPPATRQARQRARPRISSRRRAASGTAMIEFTLVGPILTLLGLAILQYGMLFFAKNQINYAAFMAARAGSMGNAKMAGITTAYVKALIPLYGGGTNPAELATAYAKAVADTAGTLQVQVLSPTKESFDDYNNTTLEAVYGARAYANTAQVYSDPRSIGANSGQSFQDANLLKLRIVHGYAPKVPLISAIYTRFLQWLDPGNDAFHTALVNAGRIPVVTNVTVQMQSDPVEDVNVSTPGPGNNGDPTDPGDPPSGGVGDPPNCGTIGCSVPSTPVDPGHGGGNCP